MPLGGRGKSRVGVEVLNLATAAEVVDDDGRKAFVAASRENMRKR
jgi:hypothetical protein